MDTPQTDVSPDEVKAFIAQQPVASAPVTTKLDVTAAELGVEPPKPEAAETQNPLEADDTFAEGKPTHNELMAKMVKDMFDFTLEQIKPSEAEMETFIEAVWADVPVQLTITLPGFEKFPFVIKARSNWEENGVVKLLAHESHIKEVEGVAGWNTRLQYYCAAFQLIKAGKKDYEPPTLKAPISVEKDYESIAAYMEKNFGAMSSPNWKLVSGAMALFEARVNYMDNQLIRRDFLKPAG